MRVVIDTNTYAVLSRRTETGPLDDAIKFAEKVVLPSAVVGELYAGFYGGTRFEENRRLLEAFLASNPVEIAVADEETAIKYGRIQAELRKQGTPIPTNDIWIAATAFQHGLTILTFDSHFKQVPFVDVELFERGTRPQQ